VRATVDGRWLAGVFAAAEVEWAIVKGPQLAVSLYRRPDLRPFADIDVLTPRRQFSAAVTAVEESGGRQLARNWLLARRMQLGELPLRLPARSLMDLHWHMVNDRRQRADFRLGWEDLMLDSLPGDFVPEGRTTSPVSTLLYVAWHATHSGANRLIWACDIELAARQVDEVGTCLARSRELGVTLPVGVALSWVARLFPAGRAAELARGWPASVWRTAAAGSLARAQERPQGVRSGQVLARCTREQPAASVAALIRHVVRRSTPPRGASLHEDAGGPSARQAFLRGVSGGSG